MAKEPDIRKVYNPTEAQYKELHRVYTRKQQMGDARGKFDKNWDGYERQWNSERPTRDIDDWKSNIYIPMTSSVIEAELSEIINQELRPWVLERGAEDQPKAMVANAIMDYTWEVSKSDVALVDICKDALIMGTGIGMEYYRREYRTIKTKDGKDKKILDFDDCYLEPIRLFDFFVDETARSFSGPYPARDCIRRVIMDYDAFRNFFTGDTWDPFKVASLVKPGGDTNYYEFYQPPNGIDQSRQVECLWYWNRPEDVLSIVVNDILVVTGPNPYMHKQLPFIRVTDVRRPHQFYGKGEAELLESLQEEANTLRRMVVDRNHLDIDKPILVSDTITLEDEDIITRPHGLIQVGDVNGAKPLEYGDIPRSVFLSLEMLNDDKIRVTGMDERQQSVSTAGTATEAAILKEATLKRLNMKIWQIKNDTLVDIGRLRMANIMQFYSQPKLEEITGEDMAEKAKSQGRLVLSGGKKMLAKFRNIRLKDQAMSINTKTQQPEIVPAKGYTFFEANPKFFLPSYGDFDIRYKASSSMPISKPLEQQKADEMYDRLITNPTTDPWKLAEYMLKTRELPADDFKRQAPGQQKPTGPQLQQMVDLAGMENAEMMQGKEIGPTPYASTVHTEIHLQFMQSEKFKKDVPPEDTKIIQLFTNHIMGEIAAQTARGSEGAPPSDPNNPNGQITMEGQMAPPQELTPQAVNPGMIPGGGGPEGAPSGMEGANSGVQVGRSV